MFNGLISRNLAILDTLNMTMLNDKGVAVLLEVSTSKNTAIASEDYLVTKSLHYFNFAYLVV
jgi:hypothetical protein